MIDSSSVGARGADPLAAQVRRRATRLRPSASREQRRGIRALPRQRLGDVADALAERLRVDAALQVVRDLLLAAAVGLVDRDASSSR